MAKLPTLKRLFKNEFKPEYSDLVEKLIVSINNGFDNIYDSLNNKITLKNNMLCDIKDVETSVSPSGDLLNDINLYLTFKNNVNSVVIGMVQNKTTPGLYPKNGVTVIWEPVSQGIIKIKHISGLQGGSIYNIRLVIYGDDN